MQFLKNLQLIHCTWAIQILPGQRFMPPKARSRTKQKCIRFFLYLFLNSTFLHIYWISRPSQLAAPDPAPNSIKQTFVHPTIQWMWLRAENSMVIDSDMILSVIGFIPLNQLQNIEIDMVNKYSTHFFKWAKNDAIRLKIILK